jgi:hypothetical protein
LGKANDLVRVGRRGFTWDMPRRFQGFAIADPAELTIQGAAPKVIVRKIGRDGETRYIAKRPEKFGEVETYTEFFSNQLGLRLGFNMAHSGLMKIDGQLHFASKSFLSSEERLVHGSLLVAEALGEKQEIEEIKGPAEQRFYSIAFIVDVMGRMCAESAAAVVTDLIAMLVFDSLIGSMDRHGQNWGVVSETQELSSYRLAPIFDTARALLWDHDDPKILKLTGQEHQFQGYLRRARPCMGIEGEDTVNHFKLVAHLLRWYRSETVKALDKIQIDKVRKGIKILSAFPFDRAFSKLRSAAIARVLIERATCLGQIAEGVDLA